MRNRVILSFIAGVALTLGAAAPVLATPSPNGPGQPGAPGTTCGNIITTQPQQTPGSSASANGAAFNPNGIAGLNYAGNPGTASLANANSVHAVSQYDVACFQVTTH